MMTLNEPKAMQRSISRGLTAGVALPHFAGFDCLTKKRCKGTKEINRFHQSDLYIRIHAL